jgi:predicted aspartyl protease
MKQVKTDALVDTGADMTCLPAALINALGAEPASTYEVFGINGVSIGLADTYFLEFEIQAAKKLVEVIAVGDEPILGRNLINEFTLQFHGPAQELSITLGAE